MHTGNIIGAFSPNCTTPVYPCAYREHIMPLQQFSRARGLSLCIQGTCRWGSNWGMRRRFIPVHTGNMHVFVTDPNQCPGLSLCIQGTLRMLAFLVLANRFIPVHTGNMILTKLTAPISAVYPCAYREHDTYAFPLTHECGLSLCIQGTSHPARSAQNPARFIPVHTGNIVLGRFYKL